MKKSIQNYKKFSKICIVLCIFGILLSFITLNFTTAFFIVFVLGTCIGAFYFSLWILEWILLKDDDNYEMQKVAVAIRQGADGYLKTQYGMISYIAAITAIVLFFIFLLRGTPTGHGETLSSYVLAFFIAISFLIGSFCSALAGYMGVWVSVRTNIRVAIAASDIIERRNNAKKGDAMLITFRGGAVSAILSAAMCILGITLLYLIAHFIIVTCAGYNYKTVPITLGGYGFGASFVALFMQLGGGIYLY